MHYWGDDWPYWDELNDAISYIQDYVYKYSRCYLMCKEKYGTLRYEHVIPPKGSPYFLRYMIRSPFNITKTIAGESFTYKPILWSWNDSYSYIYRLWHRLGNYVLHKAVKKACILYPNVKEELLDDYDRAEEIVSGRKGM